MTRNAVRGARAVHVHGRRPTVLIALLALACGGLAAWRNGAVRAGTALRMELADLARHADLVLQGRVLSARGVLAADGRIDTEYVLAVERTFWGEPIAQRVVRIPGGELPDGRGMLLSGVTRLVPGEDVVLFLGAEGPDAMRMPVGLAQGELRLVSDAAGRRFLVREQAGLHLADPRGGVVRRADGFASFEYAPFLAELEAALSARRAALDAAREGGR